MSSVNLLPPGFHALLAMAAIAIALGIAVLVQRARKRPVRGPLAALAATALAYLVLVGADQLRFRSDAAMALLRVADAWALGWAAVAALVWWGGVAAGVRPLISRGGGGQGRPAA